jgi:hypothetical protein
MAEMGLGLDDQMLAHRRGLGEYSLLPIDGILLILEEGPRGVDLDHVTAFEIIQLMLRGQPLRVEIEAGHIVANIVEIATECTTRFPPPLAAARTQNHRRSRARRAIGQHLGRRVHNRRLIGIPRLTNLNGTDVILRRFDQMMQLDCRPFLGQKTGRHLNRHEARGAAFPSSTRRQTA